MSIPSVTKLSSRVVRVLGLNPGPFTLQGTNTYLVGSGRQRMLIDTGDGRAEYLELLDSIMEKEDITLCKILITHWHPDHSGGIAPILKKYPHNLIQAFKKAFPAQDHNFAGRIIDLDFNTFEPEPIKVEGATVVPISTPGHTLDHVSFYLVEESVLFSGDCILGEGTTTFKDLSTYLATLNKLLLMFPPIKHIYPGHGHVVMNGREKIVEYIKHREERENLIFEILQSKPPPEVKHPKYHEGRPAYSASDIVAIIYKGYPSSVLEKAQLVVTLHLKKLEDESKVRKDHVSSGSMEELCWQWVYNSSVN